MSPADYLEFVDTGEIEFPGDEDRNDLTLVLVQGRLDPSDVLQEAYLEAAARLPEYQANPTLPPFVWLIETMARRYEIYTREQKARLLS